MAELTILSSGPCTTIQDHGRTGFQAFGVPEGGAQDYDALVTANWLVGNAAHAGGLECYGGGLEFTADCSLAIALSGTARGSLNVTAADGAVAEHGAGRTVFIRAGDRISLAPMRDSNLAFISLSAEIDLPRIYGSQSTSVNARLGGLDGRRFADGDRLPLIPVKDRPAPRILSDCAAFFACPERLRVVLGPQDYAFDSQQTERLLDTNWTLTSKMDRMGVRLKGPQILHKHSADILSDGIVKGAIQVPGDGQPIIMMADHQTTGGYTKIACVISADLGALARLHPNRTVRFQAVTQQEAEALARQHAGIRRSLMVSHTQHSDRQQAGSEK